MGWGLAFAYSFAPFDFGSTGRTGLANGEATTQLEAAALALHLLAFAALGGIERLGSGGGSPNRRIRLAVLVRGLFYCLAIELGQMFLPSRHAELLDLLVNVTGLVLGHVSVGWLGPTWGANWQLSLARPFFRATLLLLWAIVWCVVVLLPLFCARLDDWDPTYRLLIGNEEGGGRRWDGEIQSIAVFARSLTDDQVRIMLDHPPGREESTLIRRTMGLLWASDFTRVGRVETSVDAAEVSSDLQINLPSYSRWTAETPPGLILDGRHLLGTVGAAESLTESIVRSDAFSIEVWCRPANLIQLGPAGIVGISHGIWRRNFTLGQEAHALIFRVRNRLNGVNGDRFALLAPAALRPAQVQIVATYDRGLSSMFRDGRRLNAVIDLREPSVLLGLGARPAGQRVTSVFAAATLVLFYSGFVPWPARAVKLVRLILAGYAVLLMPLVGARLTSHELPATLHIWFGPAVVTVWFLSQRTR